MLINLQGYSEEEKVILQSLSETLALPVKAVEECLLKAQLNKIFYPKDKVVCAFKMRVTDGK